MPSQTSKQSVAKRMQVKLVSTYIYWSAAAMLSQLCLFYHHSGYEFLPLEKTWFFLLADLELAEA